jgi:hypothetical protein
MTERIDNNNVHYRFDYFSKFINFICEDIKALNNFASVILQFIENYLNMISQKIILL